MGVEQGIGLRDQGFFKVMLFCGLARPDDEKFPVFSQITGNLASETGSLVTASSSGESSANSDGDAQINVILATEHRERFRRDALADREIGLIHDIPSATDAVERMMAEAGNNH